LLATMLERSEQLFNYKYTATQKHK